MLVPVADLERGVHHWRAKRTRKFRVATPTSGQLTSENSRKRTEYLEATLGLVKRLETSKELMSV